MTAILSCPFLGWDFTVRTDEDWRDSSYQYLDASGTPIPWDGIAHQFVMRRAATDPVVFVSATTSGLYAGAPANGTVLTAPGVWGLVVPRAVMLKVPAGAYVWEMQAVAEVTRTIGQGAVTVVQGLFR